MKQREPNSTHAPDILLERYVLGELSAEESEKVRNLLGESPELAARVEAIVHSNQELLTRFPPSEIASRISDSLANSSIPEKRTTPLFWLGVAGPAAAAALIALFWLASPPDSFMPNNKAQPNSQLGSGLPSSEDSTTQNPVEVASLEHDSSSDPTAFDTESVRAKGGPRLLIFRKTATGVEELSDGSTVRSGDNLQVAYVAAGMPYGAILSVDGRGSRTLHFPRGPAESTQLSQGDRHMLEFSYVLDDAPGFEVFYFFVSNMQIDIRKIIGQQIDNSPTKPVWDLPAGVDVVVFALKKAD